MGKSQLRVGLIFNFNPKWMGGIIYLINAIRILNFLEEKDKPSVVIFYNPILKKYIDEIEFQIVIEEATRISEAIYSKKRMQDNMGISNLKLFSLRYFYRFH
jgi:hypothetical protein